MSYYLANEKWIDRSGDPAGLLGQRATISGLGQISRAADAKDYPALPEFFAEGLSDKVIEVREELAQLARDTCDGDVATTAKDMRDLAIGQTLLVITDGCYADTEGEGEEPVEFVGSCSPLRKRQAMLQPSEIGRPTCVGSMPSLP
ncbi:MAG: hypothetical protein NTW28_27425 [Candidatus Solibacter sp.]|nr:hypothetical protein [Candidatus Solibacter sp.]